MDLREGLGTTPEKRRRALRVLLDGDRMRTHAGADRDFRVERLLRPGALATPESHEPPGEHVSERFACRVAGGRSATFPLRRTPPMRLAA